METKTRITISIDIEIASKIDALCFPIARSLFINELLTESLRLVREKRISLAGLNSPVLRKSLDEFRECELYPSSGRKREREEVRGYA